MKPTDLGGLASDRTLLDEFAIQLLAAYISRAKLTSLDEAARDAYSAAAALIAEKRKRETPA